MYWTLELASYLEDAPWPATKDELIDYAIWSGATTEVVEKLKELNKNVELWAFKYSLANVLRETVGQGKIYYIDDILNQIKLVE